MENITKNDLENTLIIVLRSFGEAGNVNGYQNVSGSVNK